MIGGLEKISAILPLKTSGRHYADNIARCDILFSSLRAFTTPAIFDRILIVVPHDELQAARQYAIAWQDFPVEVVDESLHFKAFGDFSGRHQIRPWHRQQIIKLYASELIDTEYFLVLDPDVFATRRFDLRTLLPRGRALTYMQPRKREARYWRDSATILEQQPDLERDGIWMTPALLSRTLCRRLHRRLEALHKADWMHVLLSRYTMDWTEYTLYWLNAEREGLIDQFHAGPEPGSPQLHADESVWFAGAQARNLKEWYAERYFAPDSTSLFAVVQSNTGIGVDAVVRKLQPFMEITLQPYERHRSPGLKAAEFYSAVMRRMLGGARKLIGK
jgi:hypothetical protein